MNKIRELFALIVKSAQIPATKIFLVIAATAILVLAVVAGYYWGQGSAAGNKPVAGSERLPPLPFGAVTDGIKGVDFSGLDANQERLALRLLNIAACLASDGMVSVARCRRDVPHCVTSQRMADFIVHKVKQGEEEEVILSRLYEKAVKEGGAIAVLGEDVADIPDADLPRLGPKDAPVGITFFYDYTSAISRLAWDKLAELRHLYPERVRFMFWPLPRSRMDERAEKAARVALAAHRLKKFDVVHSLLMNSEGSIEDGRLDDFTRQAGLEPGVLNGEAVAPPVRSQMKKLNKLADQMGLHYPPIIFVQGKRIKGAVPGACLLVGSVQQAVAEAITAEYDEISRKIAPH